LPRINDEKDLTFSDSKRIIFLQILLAILTAAILFFSIEKLTRSHLAAVLGAMFYVLDLPSATMAFYMYTDMIFTFFVFLGTIFLIFGLRDDSAFPSGWMLFFSGLSWGLAALTRVNAIYVFAPVALILLIPLLRR